MGDFRDVMTVRELTDIVSYIRSLDDQDNAIHGTGGAS
jgi:hypothetical protein